MNLNKFNSIILASVLFQVPILIFNGRSMSDSQDGKMRLAMQGQSSKY